MHIMVIADPETYFFTPTPHVPNSRLPVLVYRDVLPHSPTAESTRAAIEQNKWLQGGVFKHYPAHHFHSVTHECYAVFQGSSRLLLGRGPLDDLDRDGGAEVELATGDIIVLPVRLMVCSDLNRLVMATAYLGWSQSLLADVVW